MKVSPNSADPCVELMSSLNTPPVLPTSNTISPSGVFIIPASSFFSGAFSASSCIGGFGDSSAAIFSPAAPSPPPEELPLSPDEGELTTMLLVVVFLLFALSVIVTLYLYVAPSVNPVNLVEVLDVEFDIV